MTKFKKLALLCTALLTSLSLGIFASCGKTGTESGSESSSLSNSASSVEEISSSIEESSSSEESISSESNSSSEESNSSESNSSSEESNSSESNSSSEESNSSESNSSSEVSNSSDSNSSSEESTSSDSNSSSEESTSSESNSSSEESNSSDSSSSSDDGSCLHVWSEWELVTEPLCEEDGVKKRYCLHDESHVDYGTITMRGHDYGDEAACKRCGIAPTLNTDHSGAIYTQVEDCETGGDSTLAKGSEYNRYELTEGYYTVEALRGGVWISVSVDGAGQYALYTIDGSNGVNITRFDASVQYINYDEHPAVPLGDNDVISVVNCGDNYWNPNWRATWKIQKSSPTSINFVIEKIDDPAWQPKYVKTSVIAQEINGVRASEGPENTVLAEVPYDAEYFFDSEVGYYRMGTPKNPGALIYAAITKVPPRLLYDRPFSQIESQGSNLTLGDGWGFGEAYTVDGDYNLLYYPPFIMVDTNYNGTPGNCYEQFVNSDGVYPVTQELFKFLNLYVFNKKPFDENIPAEDFENKADYMWLSACYYYAELQPGTKEYPLELSMGENTVSLPDFDFLYCNFKGDGYHTISCDTEGVILTVNGINISSPFSVTVVADLYGGKAFELSAESFLAMDAIVSIEKASGLLNYSFSATNGVESLFVTPDENGKFTVDTITVYDSEIAYFAHYCFNVTEIGTYTFTADTNVMFQIDGLSLNNGAISIAVTEEYLAEGLPIQIYIMAEESTSLDVTVSYSSELPPVEETPSDDA